MKALQFLLFSMMFALILLSCAVQKTEEQIKMEALADEILYSGKQVYLAHNLWYENPDKIEAINFKTLPFKIEAGTPVKNVIITYYNNDPRIRFKVMGEVASYYILINLRYQKNDIKKLTYKELVARTFTTIPFDEFTSGLKQEEIDNIKHGTIQRGMSKKAVLMSWGYPPLHFTRKLDDSRWTYWKMRVQKEYVDFDKDDRVLNSSWYGNNGNANDIIK